MTSAVATTHRLDEYVSIVPDNIRYSDTDRQGHVNHAVYSTMFETGRVSILFDELAPRLAEDCSYVLARTEIDYHAQLHWPGSVEIASRLVTIGRSSLEFDQGLFQRGVCVASARSIIVHVRGGTRRSEVLSPDARSYFSRFIAEGKGAA